MSSVKCLVVEYKYDLGCVAPAIVIIIVLSFMKKRVKLRPDLCNGRPAIPVPVDFLGNDSRRFTVAFAFGATAALCFKIFMYSVLPSGTYSQLSPWQEAFYTFFWSLNCGIINYPYLACLNADCTIVGAIIGLVYSFARFLVELVIYFGCDYSNSFKGNLFLKYMDFVVSLPSILCTIFLIRKFAVVTYREMKYHLENRTTSQETKILGFCFRRMDKKPLARDTDKLHVKLLLLNRLNERRIDLNAPLYIRIKDKLFEPRADFRFSKQFLSALVVSIIFIYQVTIFMISLDIITFSSLQQQYPSEGTLLATLQGFVIVSQVLASFVSLLQILHFIKSHREDVIEAYRTNNGLLQNTVLQPRTLVIKSLQYCGYQIALTGIGLIVMGFAIFCLLLPLWWVTYMTLEKGKDKVFQLLKKDFLTLSPIIAISTLTWIISNVLSRLVFRDRSYSGTNVTIDNRRTYCVMSYFYFFLKILVGVWSALKSRVLKVAVLGLFYIPRIDRTLTMKGFPSMDSGHEAYVSFIKVLVSYRHPVMLCFCQLLIDRRSAPRSVGRQSSDERSRLSTKALNRWFLAVLLIRNPSLVRYRKECIASPDTHPTAWNNNVHLEVIDSCSQRESVNNIYSMHE